VNDSVIVVVIKVNIDKTFSLDEAANGPDYQRDIHPRGKGVTYPLWLLKSNA
jgi:hypothetical protein